MDVVGDDKVGTGAGGKVGQPVVADGVERVAVIPQLHDDVLAAEQVDETVERPAGSTRPFVDKCARHGTFATTGEHLPVMA